MLTLVKLFQQNCGNLHALTDHYNSLTGNFTVTGGKPGQRQLIIAVKIKHV